MAGLLVGFGTLVLREALLAPPEVVAFHPFVAELPVEESALGFGLQRHIVLLLVVVLLCEVALRYEARVGVDTPFAVSRYLL
jgi:hypothetical protein